MPNFQKYKLQTVVTKLSKQKNIKRTLYRMLTRTSTRRRNSKVNNSFMYDSYIEDSYMVKDYHSGVPTLQKVIQQSGNFNSL